MTMKSQTLKVEFFYACVWTDNCILRKNPKKLGHPKPMLKLFITLNCVALPSSRVDPDQTANQDQFDLGLHCLLRFMCAND